MRGDDRMARAKICDGRPSFFQWDTGAEIELCECETITEVHFATPNGTIKRDVKDNICSVPDVALQTAGALVVYAFLRDTSGGITRHEMRIGVIARPKPADYIDPPDESDTIDLIVERVAGLIDPGGGVYFKTDETLTLEDGILSVNTADDVEQDNTLPITSAAVYTEVGNINALLETI